jgi:hypothetical protein
VAQTSVNLEISAAKALERGVIITDIEANVMNRAFWRKLLVSSTTSFVSACEFTAKLMLSRFQPTTTRQSIANVCTIEIASYL